MSTTTGAATAATSAEAAAALANRALWTSIGRVVWEREFRAANPGATPAELRAAWKSARPEYLKVGRWMQSRLARAGITLQAAPTERRSD
ncbi:hypothetical protein [Falsiroseomonas oryzae]|uniref:hypothetical protein n=1 Tax=Falsiroseomonas oryzae TaxID=2766473 RepID=UPI0022EA99F2|nr:hypothetical protein [Roseomonas sp. MO-31]